MKKIMVFLMLLITITLQAATYEKVMQKDKFGEEDGTFVMMMSDVEYSSILAIDKSGSLALINGEYYSTGTTMDMSIKIDGTIYEEKVMAISSKILMIVPSEELLKAMFKGNSIKFSIRKSNGTSQLSKFDLIGFKDAYEKTVKQ